MCRDTAPRPGARGTSATTPYPTTCAGALLGPAPDHRETHRGEAICPAIATTDGIQYWTPHDRHQTETDAVRVVPALDVRGRGQRTVRPQRDDRGDRRAGGKPSARTILLKGVDPRGFVFYTNTQSRKGDELAANHLISLLFYWKSLGRQIRVEGRVEPVTAAEADAYYATRPRISRLGAWASDQSRPLSERAELERRLRRFRRKISRRGHPSPAALVRLSRAAGAVRVLAEHAVPPARPHHLRARAGRRLDQRQAVSLTAVATRLRAEGLSTPIPMSGCRRSENRAMARRSTEVAFLTGRPARRRSRPIFPISFWARTPSGS